MPSSSPALSRRRLFGISVASLATIAGVTGIARSSAHDGHDSDDHATPAASPAASPVASATSFAISTVDLAFKPKELTIPANTDVELVVTNDGKLPHDFTVPQLGISSGNLLAGESATIAVNIGPGSYPFQCSVPGHKQAGMFGTLIAE